MNILTSVIAIVRIRKMRLRNKDITYSHLLIINVLSNDNRYSYANVGIKMCVRSVLFTRYVV